MKNKIKVSDFAIVKTLSALRISKDYANIVVTSLARNYVTEKEIRNFSEVLIEKALKQRKKFVISDTLPVTEVRGFHCLCGLCKIYPRFLLIPLNLATSTG